MTQRGIKETGFISEPCCAGNVTVGLSDSRQYCIDRQYLHFPLIPRQNIPRMEDPYAKINSHNY